MRTSLRGETVLRNTIHRTTQIFFFAVITELGGNESISPISARVGGTHDGVCEKPLGGTSTWQQRENYRVKGGSVLDFLLTPKKKVSVQVSSSKT